MSNILALDLGEKTIGIAFCDDSNGIALPGSTLLRQEGWKKDMAALRQIVSDRQIDEIVIGMPIKLDGSYGIQAEKVIEFVRVLRGSVRIPIVTQDERFSTGEAEKALISANIRREKRKQTIDSMAASIILQTYLARKRFQTGSATPSDVCNELDSPSDICNELDSPENEDTDS